MSQPDYGYPIVQTNLIFAGNPSVPHKGSKSVATVIVPYSTARDEATGKPKCWFQGTGTKEDPITLTGSPSPARTDTSEVDYFGGTDMSARHSGSRQTSPVAEDPARGYRSRQAVHMIRSKGTKKLNTDHEFNTRGTCVTCGAWRLTIAKCRKLDNVPAEEAHNADKTNPAVYTNHSFQSGVCRRCGAMRRELKMCCTMSTAYRQDEEVDYVLHGKDFGKRKQHKKSKSEPKK